MAAGHDPGRPHFEEHSKMNLQDALDRFLVQLEADGRSPHTIGQYRRHVTAFGAWLAHGGPRRAVATVGHEDVAAFLAAPVARTAAHGGPKRAISMNAMRTSLRCFFRYLHEAGVVAQNPARLVRRAMCAPPPPRAFTDDERDRLLRTLNRARGFEAERDYAIIHLLLATGIRLGSCIALDVEDVDLSAGELRLKSTKGDRPERVFLAKGIADHVRRWLGGRGAGPLFTDRRGRRLSPRHVHRRFKAWLRAAGIGRAASPHTARHTFATGLLARTGNLALVQAALRHRSITSTLVYARIEPTLVRRAIDVYGRPVVLTRGRR
jgi:site-specific recombinase XerC